MGSQLKLSKKLFSGRTNTIISFALLSLMVLANVAQSQFPEKLIQNPCVSKTTCRDCIQTKSCAWCLQPDFGDKPRCFQPSLSSFAGGCAEEYTWNPDHEEHLLVREELTRAGSAAASGGAQQSIAGGSYEASSSRQSYSGSSFESSQYSKQRETSASSSRKGYSQNTQYGSYSESGKIVQIYPQRVALKLRISKSYLNNWFFEMNNNGFFLLFTQTKSIG